MPDDRPGRRGRCRAPPPSCGRNAHCTDFSVRAKRPFADLANTSLPCIDLPQTRGSRTSWPMPSSGAHASGGSPHSASWSMEREPIDRGLPNTSSNRLPLWRLRERRQNHRRIAGCCRASAVSPRPRTTCPAHGAGKWRESARAPHLGVRQRPACARCPLRAPPLSAICRSCALRRRP